MSRIPLFVVSVCALVIAGVLALATPSTALAQEVKQPPRPAPAPGITPSNVTQDMLNRAIDKSYPPRSVG